MFDNVFIPTVKPRFRTGDQVVYARSGDVHWIVGKCFEVMGRLVYDLCRERTIISGVLEKDMELVDRPGTSDPGTAV